jgi:hypothetical protein
MIWFVFVWRTDFQYPKIILYRVLHLKTKGLFFYATIFSFIVNKLHCNTSVLEGVNNCGPKSTHPLACIILLYNRIGLDFQFRNAIISNFHDRQYIWYNVVSIFPICLFLNVIHLLTCIRTKRAKWGKSLTPKNLQLQKIWDFSYYALCLVSKYQYSIEEKKVNSNLNLRSITIFILYKLFQV